jgi:DNA-binding winged helix-turn-helix (wHTH) protein/TolB-like protein/cytochrome c-type biogenesis protein CcmH/NrfG
MATPARTDVLPDELGLGEWRVRLAEGVLEAPGRQARLEPKVAALLECLIRNRGRMVSREELLETVWGDTVVAPVALARAVSELRSALGDDAKVPRYVATYPKRGYRLLAPVDLEPVAPAPPDAAAPTKAATRSRAALGLVALLLGLVAAASHRSVPLPAAAGTSLVVIPFRGLDPESARFAVGLTDDVFRDLAAVDDVQVWPRGRTAEELERGVVLEGTVRLGEGRLRVTARLREQPGGAEIWAEAFDRDAAPGAGARSDVAGRIVHGLRIHGLRARRTRGARAAAARAGGPSALETFRRGRAQLAGRDLRSVLDAQRTFEHLVEREPRFTLGRTGLALALAMRTARTNELEHARRAVREAEAAVAEDPNLPEAHQTLGRAHLVLGHHRRAVRAAGRALDLHSDFLMALADRARAWTLLGELERAWAAEVDLTARDHPPWRPFTRGRVGQLLLLLGLRPDARRWLEHALRADPHDVDAGVALARLEVLEGERAEARRRMQALVAVDPTCRPCLVLLGQIGLLEGDSAAARRALTRALDLPGRRSEALTALAAASRGEAVAPRLLEEARTEVQGALDEGSEDGTLRLSLAAIAAVQADAESAARWCGEAVDAGWRDHSWTRVDPAFTRVRPDPRFAACLDRARGLVRAAGEHIGKVAQPGS